jgi:FAD/FMN-containing dehydrogenase
MEASQRKMTDVLMPKIEAVTPGSGSYMNEADFQQKDWQNVFYGSNYGKLKQIKDKYDPEHVFYNIKSVGSDAWTVGPDGRMCRA